MKKLSLMAVICIAGFSYAISAAESGDHKERNFVSSSVLLEQDTVTRTPDTTKTPSVPDKRIPMPTDPSQPNPSPIPMPPSPTDPNPSPSPLPNPLPTPTTPTPSVPTDPMPGQ